MRRHLTYAVVAFIAPCGIVLAQDKKDTISKKSQLSEVEVFGSRYKQPEKLDAITRLPLKPSDQIQSISIISDRLISAQGALSIGDATRNVPGVYMYSTYGNTRESISSRGFRGIPVLKNGVRVHSDFRGQGFLADMEGVESIQVLKGANAITQGVATDLGSPGGIVNIVTKTPKFTPGGRASLRVGSWGQVRPSFDVWGTVNEAKTLAFRLNGAYERADNYRAGVSMERFYLNPSVEWRPDAKTTVTVEMDYLDDSRTPDAGTINLSTTKNEFYDMPFDRNPGFEGNRNLFKNATYAARFKRELGSNLYVRAAFFRSTLESSSIGTFMSQFIDRATGDFMTGYAGNIVQRTLEHSNNRNDKNNILQFDLVGKDIATGALKHTFQVGLDYRSTAVTALTFAPQIIDTIDLFKPLNRKLPSAAGFRQTGESVSNATSLGVMAQDVITLTHWMKAFMGVRFSSTQTTAPTATTASRSTAINPLGGVLVTPVKGLNLFASYTSSTVPTGNQLDEHGNTLGNERIDQLEAGVKSEWFSNRLRFNVTVYKINNKNMNLQAARWENGTLVQLPYFMKGGNDERKGVEVELTGRVLENLEVVAGYAYIDAQYKEHTTFVPGSAPNNTPRHTANFWVNYTVQRGALRGLSAGGGVYYVGDRPVNDWTQRGTNFHAIVPGVKPWNTPGYTTANLQLAYDINKHIGLQLFCNNLLDAKGYTTYRTVYINRIDPRNFAGMVHYRF